MNAALWFRGRMRESIRRNLALSFLRDNPRAIATITAMPDAALKKFCTVNASIISDARLRPVFPRWISATPK